MRSVLFIAFLLIAAGVGFWMGTSIDYMGNWDEYEVSQEANQFQGVIDKVTAYVRVHDGQMPADPYGGLIDGNTTRFRDFMIDNDFVRFEIDELPPRINVDLAKNTKAPMFYLPRHDKEVWVAYLDGSWERVHVAFPVLGLGGFAGTRESWAKKLRDAGFPHWGSIDEKGAWMKNECGRLIWDDKKGMYVVKRPA